MPFARPSSPGVPIANMSPSASNETALPNPSLVPSVLTETLLPPE